MAEHEQPIMTPTGSRKVNDPYWTGEERLTLVLGGVVLTELYDQAIMDDFHGLSDGTHPYGAPSFVSHETSEVREQSELNAQPIVKTEPAQPVQLTQPTQPTVKAETGSKSTKKDIQSQILTALKNQEPQVPRQVKSEHGTVLQEVPRYAPRRPGTHVSQRQSPQPKLSNRQFRAQRAVRGLRRQTRMSQHQHQHHLLQQPPQPQRQVQQRQKDQQRQSHHDEPTNTRWESNEIPVAPHRGFWGPRQNQQLQSQPQPPQDPIPSQQQNQEFFLGTEYTPVSLRWGAQASEGINHIPVASKRGFQGL